MDSPWFVQRRSLGWTKKKSLQVQVTSQGRMKHQAPLWGLYELKSRLTGYYLIAGWGRGLD